MGDSQVKLSVKNLRKRFDNDLLKVGVDVLCGVDLQILEGEIFGFLGPNGAGKTTTIKSIVGLIRPDEGEIIVCGEPHNSMRAKSKLGFMPETPGFYNHLTAKELLSFYAQLLGLPAKTYEARAMELLNTVGLERHADNPVKTFSKGMTQRLALAQALINEPELLILDEPLSGLDPIGRKDFREIILDLNSQGVTIFFSSHIIPDVESLCDRVAFLIEGKVHATGKVADIVSMEVEEFEITFSGIQLGKLQTPHSDHHEGSDSTWIKVNRDNRDKMILEISNGGGQMMSLNPVRSTLEDVLIDKFQEVRS